MLYSFLNLQPLDQCFSENQVHINCITVISRSRVNSACRFACKFLSFSLNPVHWLNWLLSPTLSIPALDR